MLIASNETVMEQFAVRGTLEFFDRASCARCLRLSLALPRRPLCRGAIDSQRSSVAALSTSVAVT
ncbi:hypothetical protein RTCIAT899_PC00450 (plasmid) [Rhizobium tropici CIAT 899]|nr:hypothetical protein RTCIAT899_PC00450 [Rhizobium tropici CIAT 899]